MALFEKGQAFFNPSATNQQGTKGKYFLAITSGDCEDDYIICFVLNTEHRMDIYSVSCNKVLKSNKKKVNKFILEPEALKFLTKYTAVMLSLPVRYKLKDIMSSEIKLLDSLDDKLVRQIKNCIDVNNIEPVFPKIIKNEFS